MTIKKDLFLAILSMDVYNRGYGAGISDEKHVENNIDLGLGDAVGIQIGNATINFRTDSDPQGAAAAAGFYAVAYTVGEGVEGLTAGTTVISYRGTDAIFRGERGVAGWLKGENALPNAKGFGSMPSLTVSASNDFALAETLKRAA